MSQKRLPGKGVYHTKRFYASDAYWSLNGSAIKVLEIFYLKRQLIDSKIAQKLKIPSDSAKMIRNNGEIIFTYKEAEEYGISNDVFTKSIDKLIYVGFIDISEIGGNRIPNKYAMSNRWIKYGTSDAETKRRPNKGKNMIGIRTRFTKKSESENKQITPVKTRVCSPAKTRVKNKIRLH